MKGLLRVVGALDAAGGAMETGGGAGRVGGLAATGIAGERASGAVGAGPRFWMISRNEGRGVPALAAGLATALAGARAGVAAGGAGVAIAGAGPAAAISSAALIRRAAATGAAAVRLGVVDGTIESGPGRPAGIAGSQRRSVSSSSARFSGLLR